jgi:hypothetical protein
MARQLIGLSTERELPAWRVAGTIFEGWSRAEAGDRMAGIAQIPEGLVEAKTTEKPHADRAALPDGAC